MASSTEQTSDQRKPLRGVRVGVVTSDKRDKTRTVAVQFQAKHPKYGKYIRKRTVLHVHDKDNQSHEGDRVEIVACRPISKTVSWRLVKVVETSAGEQFTALSS